MPHNRLPRPQDDRLERHMNEPEMAEHEVLIAGGGPVGMMLAAELKLVDVDVAIVERRPDQELPGSRAGGFHARMPESLDRRGVGELFMEGGTIAQTPGSPPTTLDTGVSPPRRNHGLGLWQNHIERILAGWARELG